MLQSLTRLCRRPPPVEAARTVARPLYVGLSSAEYLAVIRARVDARREEDADVRRELQRVEEVRARIARMRRDTADRESIRSSRFVKSKEEK